MENSIQGTGIVVMLFISIAVGFFAYNYGKSQGYDTGYLQGTSEASDDWSAEYNDLLRNRNYLAQKYGATCMNQFSTSLNTSRTVCE